MIDISVGKLLLLAVIALVVLGPEKLPKAARMAGALLRRVRLGWDSVRAEVEREIQVEEIKRAANEAVLRADAARASASEVARDVQGAVVAAAASLPLRERVSDTGKPRDGQI